MAPNDDWDYDATQPLMLATLTIDGQARRVIMQANKNGFFYVLDRETGKFISAKAYAAVNWAEGIDANGRPIENPEARQLKDGQAVEPATDGGHNWHPISFNPATGLVYLGAVNGNSVHAVNRDFKIDLNDQTTGADRAYHGPASEEARNMKVSGRLLAWDPVKQQEAWHVDLENPKSGGTLTTAGNLVLTDKRTESSWPIAPPTGKSCGSLMRAWESPTPMTSSVDGTQYVSVLVGWGGPMVLNNRPIGRGNVGSGMLLTFALGGDRDSAALSPRGGTCAHPTFHVVTSPAEIEKGRVLFATFCSRCHGADVVSGGEVPDLRYLDRETHQMFEQIVRGGMRRESGMPSFADDLTSGQVHLVQAYVLDRERESAQAAGGQ